MSWLLFMDESGHDHRNMPMEVRGGVAIHASRIWDFVRDFHQAELDCFGVRLAEYSKEIKGSKLLDLKRVKWADASATLDANIRHNGVRRFLTKGLQKESPAARDFAAYGQASILMAHAIFDLLHEHNAKIFASLIPCGAKPPKDYQYPHFLRKDHIFLQERFFYFLEMEQQHGLFVMDQTEKANDRRFVRKLQDYYLKTAAGRHRTRWIVPAPLFVDSEMSPGVQAADLCLYCINWGFRLPEWSFTGPQRDDIATGFAPRCHALQFSGDGYRDGKTFKTYGIFYVPDPYTARDK